LCGQYYVSAFTAKNTTFQNTTTSPRRRNHVPVPAAISQWRAECHQQRFRVADVWKWQRRPVQCSKHFQQYRLCQYLCRYNGTPSVFNGVTTFNNSPSANTASMSAGTRRELFSTIMSVSIRRPGWCAILWRQCDRNRYPERGYSIIVGGAGFSAGTLLLRQFTVAATTAQNLP